MRRIEVELPYPVRILGVPSRRRGLSNAAAAGFSKCAVRVLEPSDRVEKGGISAEGTWVDFIGHGGRRFFPLVGAADLRMRHLGLGPVTVDELAALGPWSRSAGFLSLPSSRLDRIALGYLNTDEHDRRVRALSMLVDGMATFPETLFGPTGTAGRDASWEWWAAMLEDALVVRDGIVYSAAHEPFLMHRPDGGKGSWRLVTGRVTAAGEIGNPLEGGPPTRPVSLALAAADTGSGVRVRDVPGAGPWGFDDMREEARRLCARMSAFLWRQPQEGLEGVREAVDALAAGLNDLVGPSPAPAETAAVVLGFADACSDALPGFGGMRIRAEVEDFLEFRGRTGQLPPACLPVATAAIRR